MAFGEQLPVPEVVAIGGQSDGKSSLLEAFLGFRFNVSADVLWPAFRTMFAQATSVLARQLAALVVRLCELTRKRQLACCLATSDASMRPPRPVRRCVAQDSMETGWRSRYIASLQTIGRRQTGWQARHHQPDYSNYPPAAHSAEGGTVAARAGPRKFQQGQGSAV